MDAALAAAAASLAVVIVRAAVVPPGGEDRTPPRARLARDPLDLPALRDLGLQLDRRGRLDQADALLGFVGRRSWRDGPTEVWLLRRRLDQGRYAEALDGADSLLRRDADGATRPALFPLLIAAADEPRAQASLAARLAARPWWRGDFLRALGDGGDVTGARAVFSTLALGPAPPTADEYAPLINRLVSAGDYDGAYATWRAVARPAGPAPPVLRDGAFTGVPDHTPFTWSAASGVGASSEAGPASDGPAARALRVDYDGYASPILPAQLLIDPPRRYSLRWRERVDPAVPERLFWRVRCAATNQVLARSPPPAPGWRETTLGVETPISGCAAQWLELTAEPGERRGAVTAWYADFRLQPSP
jgi:hypothetical protein